MAEEVRLRADLAPVSVRLDSRDGEGALVSRSAEQQELFGAISAAVVVSPDPYCAVREEARTKVHHALREVRPGSGVATDAARLAVDSRK